MNADQGREDDTPGRSLERPLSQPALLKGDIPDRPTMQPFSVRVGMEGEDACDALVCELKI